LRRISIALFLSIFLHIIFFLLLNLTEPPTLHQVEGQDITKVSLVSMPDLKQADPELPVQKTGEKAPPEKASETEKPLPDKDNEKTLEKPVVQTQPKEQNPEKKQGKTEDKISETEKMPEPAIGNTETTIDNVEKEKDSGENIAENSPVNADKDEASSEKKDQQETAEAHETSVSKTTDTNRIKPDPGKIAGNRSEDQAVIDTASNKKTIHRITAGDVIKRVKPIYPRASRLRREEGTVSLIANVSGGKVISLKIESSSGHKRLDASAVDAVRKWEFSFRDEKTIRIPVIFRIDG